MTEDIEARHVGEFVVQQEDVRHLGLDASEGLLPGGTAFNIKVGFVGLGRRGHRQAVERPDNALADAGLIVNHEHANVAHLTTLSHDGAVLRFARRVS